jgi:DNA modification methylase
MKVEIVNINKVKPNPNNPRLIKNDQFKRLVKSLQEFPEMLSLREIVVDEDYVVLGGNMRLKALHEIKVKEVTVKIAEGLTPEQKKEFVIKDNAGFGEWDFDLLANEWGELPLGDWGIDLPDDFLQQDTEGLTDDDAVPDVPETPKTKLGDLWLLGDHRVLCGDSTKVEDVERLMDGENAELLFTSPPYSDMREYNGKKDLSINNLINFIPTFKPFSKYQVINLGLQRKNHEVVQYWDEYIKIAVGSGYKFLSWNVWSREGMGGSIANMSAMFRMEHEWLFVFGIEHKKNNNSVKNKTAGLHTGISNRQKDGSTLKVKPKIVKNFGRLSSVVSMCYGNSEKHPAVFPVELPEEYIKAMTLENDIVAEPFTGSGSTLIACEKTNRKCYGMELDEHYCDVIVQRWQNFTGQQAKREDGVLFDEVSCEKEKQ